jgi:hypothetical protein
MFGLGKADDLILVLKAIYRVENNQRAIMEALAIEFEAGGRMQEVEILRKRLEETK